MFVSKCVESLKHLPSLRCRSVLSRGRRGSGASAEERAPAHRGQGELHRLPHEAPRRTRYCLNHAFISLLRVLRSEKDLKQQSLYVDVSGRSA